MMLLRLFQFYLRDQASNWFERILAGSISTCEDLTTHFLAQLSLPGRTYKLRNDILMFQQHQGVSISEAWTRQSQEKDTVIRKLKDRIKSLSGKDNVENVKKDIDEIETINIEKTRVQSKEHSASLISQINAKSVENSDLNAQLQEKVFAIAALKNKLRKLKGKNVFDTVVSKPSATITPGIFKLDIEPISSKLQNNKDAHEIKAFRQYKKNRISRPPSSNQKNKIEEHPRKVKSSLNKMNFVSEPISNTRVKHSVKNAMFESICAICNKCLFDDNHDMCVIDYVNDVNVRSKSKSKRNKMRKVWKPTGKVFNEIGYSWKPIGIIVYSRRSKAPKLVGSSSKSKITESRISNSSDPDHKSKNVTTKHRIKFSMIENLTYPIFISLVLSVIPLMTVKTLLTAMASEQFSSGPMPKLLTLGTISSGLVQNIPSSTPYVPPIKNDWEILFQPMFDEYLSPLPCVDP
ncbi:retrovirus-related pol polyprotein from transposon TNT 1-94 [Tanacetum coccineum]